MSRVCAVRPFARALAGAIVLSTTGAGAQHPAEVMEPPRATGFFIGDVLERRIVATEPFAETAVEAEGARIDTFLYRLADTVDATKAGHELRRRYQVVNAPTRVRNVALPSLEVPLASGHVVRADAWQFALSPLTVAEAAQEGGGARPDQAALGVVPTPNVPLLQSVLLALMASVVLWLGWWYWRQVRDAKVLPFARARKVLSRLPPDERDTNPEAWVALHHAFNGAAGRTVGTASTGALYERAPWLGPLRDDIERFFAASDARFFAEADAATTLRLDALVDALYRLEKGG